jgi:2-keto-4-pentenoate hydratase/2-oxohepta-3-ene-1,7-dioic acid hydratase in catechol pathway
MRLATILENGRASVAWVRDRQALPLAMAETWSASVRGIAAVGGEALASIAAWAAAQPEAAYRSLEELELAPAVPDPGAIFTIGLNYAGPGEDPRDRPERPPVYGKLPSSVCGDGALVTWDRRLTANVDGESELGVVIGAPAWEVSPDEALAHVFGYTCINDFGSRDPWLDGDQWLLGKSFAGFCPVGPWIVTRDELADPTDLRLGAMLNDVPIQDGRTSQMRYSIPEIVSFLSRHVVLQPGDLIATGTPARLNGPLGPDRRLQPGDVMTIWVEGVGELTTRIGPIER